MTRPAKRKKFRMIAECDDPANPAACMAVLAGTAKALAKHRGSDPAEAIMQLLWAAAHIGRTNGIAVDEIGEMLRDAIPYAAEAERDLATRGRLQ